jgi:hypothetical protein
MKVNSMQSDLYLDTFIATQTMFGDIHIKWIVQLLNTAHMYQEEGWGRHMS